MSVSSLSDLSRQHMLDMLGAGAAKPKSQLAAGSSGSDQTSPFAQILGGLQQLQQTNSTQYSQVSQQLSSKLSAAATQAQGRGDTALAVQLNMLSKDFATASQSGQMPDFKDLETAMHSSGASQSPAATGAPASSHFSPMKMIGQMMSLAGI